MFDLIEEIKKYSAEEVINGVANPDPPSPPLEGPFPDYRKYSAQGYTDRDLLYRFENILNVSDIAKANRTLNKIATEYEGDPVICPNCKNHLDLIANDGFFCKFCGQHISIPASGNFHEIIRTKRKNIKLRQFQVADGIGVSRSRMSLLEANKKLPSAEEIRNLSYFFKCSVNEFFGMPAPRQKISSILPEYLISFQDFKRATNVPTLPVKTSNYEGYDNEFIYTCPTCGKEIDLSPGEALTIGLPAYEIMKERSTGNDGIYCKHCGQAIKRPVIQNDKKILSNYMFWAQKAI